MPRSAPRSNPEIERLHSDPAGWLRWGPYLSERAWGTVREDYSDDGDAWDYFPHDHARSRAYRWSEDGLAGISDQQQRLCFALALWNGRDPIIKERLFGLGGNEGNHGEDVKECYWYLDATPTYSWMRWRYMYPHAEFPYSALLAENRRRTSSDPEFELVDTGVFDEDRYWEVTVEYGKAAPNDICMRISAHNAGPDPAQLDLIPTLWFRNRWSWRRGITRPTLRLKEGAILAEDNLLGEMLLLWAGTPTALFCENETNTARLWAKPPPSPWCKDGIGEHVVHGSNTVNPENVGTKAALRYRLTVPPGETAVVRLRLAPAHSEVDDVDGILAERSDEANRFYASVIPHSTPTDEADIARQALSGLLWTKQFYNYDVELWLNGDPTQPAPPQSRLSGRNCVWWHLNSHDVISMPDKWEYPWFAAWDLAFHCAALAHADPDFAKQQLILLEREWYMHPSGILPAYEWAFDDVNPPVHAWSALTVFSIDGGKDVDFLERIFHKLLINFTWWVNRKDSLGKNVFEGGFLGLDNIGPFDRSHLLPAEGRLVQADATGWMAMYCLDMLKIALVLARHDRTYEDVATKFFEHFTYIAVAMTTQGLWDEQQGFYFDQLHLPDGTQVPVAAHSLVGLIPLLAVTTLGPHTFAELPEFAARFEWFVKNRPQYAAWVGHIHEQRENDNRLLSIVSPERLRRLLSRMLDEREFLSPHGIRSLSRIHATNPLEVDVGGMRFRLDYEPAESTSGLFGGNSNWRGPVWFPINHLLIAALRRFHHSLGPDFTVELPTGSGVEMHLGQVADELTRRLITLFRDGASGRRPVFGAVERFQRDPRWHGLIPFHEYFHGDTGAGLGASHQTGWTALVADLIIEHHTEPSLLPAHDSARLAGRRCLPIGGGAP
jgi:hypothetical protein